MCNNGCNAVANRSSDGNAATVANAAEFSSFITLSPEDVNPPSCVALCGRARGRCCCLGCWFVPAAAGVLSSRRGSSSSCCCSLCSRRLSLTPSLDISTGTRQVFQLCCACSLLLLALPLFSCQPFFLQPLSFLELFLKALPLPSHAPSAPSPAPSAAYALLRCAPSPRALPKPGG